MVHSVLRGIDYCGTEHTILWLTGALLHPVGQTPPGVLVHARWRWVRP